MAPMAGATPTPRVWDGRELIAGEPIEAGELDRLLMAQLLERARRARDAGAEVLDASETRMPDGSIVRVERMITMAQLRAERAAEKTARGRIKTARRNGNDDEAIAESRRQRERIIEIRRAATTTIVRPPAAHVSVPTSTAATPARPRERRATRRTRARSPGGDDPSDDEPAAPQTCACGCGLTVPPGRRRYINDAHSNRARQRQHKKLVRAERRTHPAPISDLYSDEISAACQRDVFETPEEGLMLLVAPSDRALAALAVRELVTRTFAALDSGRMHIARRAAGPVARAIFDELEADGRGRRRIAQPDRSSRAATAGRCPTHEDARVSLSGAVDDDGAAQKML